MNAQEFLTELLDDKDVARRNRRIRALKSAMPPALDQALFGDDLPDELVNRFYEVIYEARHEFDLPMEALSNPEKFRKQAAAFARAIA